MNTQSLLSLLYLSSPALPIGAFAYSQGLEAAIDKGWITTREELKEWLSGVIKHSFAQQDIPLFLRLSRAWQENDILQVSYWNAYFRASRESAELLSEDEQLGRSLTRLLISLDKITHDELPEKSGFYTVFALAAHRFDIPLKEAALSVLWSWLENQLTVACKTIPLGQTDAQTVLLSLMTTLEDAVELAFTLEDSQLGATLPGFAMASAYHETQYSRLFRS